MKVILNRIKANRITLSIFIICFILIGIVLNRIIVNDYNGEHDYKYNVLTQGQRKNSIYYCW